SPRGRLDEQGRQRWGSSPLGDSDDEPELELQEQQEQTYAQAVLVRGRGGGIPAPEVDQHGSHLPGGGKSHKDGLVDGSLPNKAGGKSHKDGLEVDGPLPSRQVQQGGGKTFSKGASQDLQYTTSSGAGKSERMEHDSTPKGRPSEVVHNYNYKGKSSGSTRTVKIGTKNSNVVGSYTTNGKGGGQGKVGGGGSSSSAETAKGK
ncbi:unnamed protein product, partial [Amoebophrya sp. A25]